MPKTENCSRDAKVHGTAQLVYKDKKIDLEVVEGTEGELGINICQLRNQTGMITLDPGFANTGSTVSTITFIDGEKGILRHRGIPIEELAEKSRFVEVAYLILFGKLPTAAELEKFSGLLAKHAALHSNLEHLFAGFPNDAPPMAILSAMLNAVACYHTEFLDIVLDEEGFMEATARIMSKVRTIAAYTYRKARGKPFIYPNHKLRYCANFLHMMFSEPYHEYEVLPEIEKALNLFFILHADHEQNCSTSTVRMVGSSRANLFSSVSAGVCALWGPLHGGANKAVIEMLESIHSQGKTAEEYLEMSKDKTKGIKLMGFGHRVYKNFDPRAKILKTQVDKVLKLLNLDDHLLNIAKELEEKALSDDYFVSRKLYPNVDFYSGILLRAIGIPIDMFTVMFAIGRMPGWIANWKELLDHNQRISRPRQIYNGPTARSYVPMSERE